MEKLNTFISNLCGHFNNENQLEREQKAGKLIHPKAEHINAVCNEKIKNLPSGFKGYFVIEESYYTANDKVNAMPHLFLFSLNSDNNVVLTSYEIPSSVEKEDFKNNNKDLVIDFNELDKSDKFTPMTYIEKDGVFSGECISTFGPGITFELKESTSKDKLVVSEVFKRNGKITFGFEDPLVYEKIKKEI